MNARATPATSARCGRARHRARRSPLPDARRLFPDGAVGEVFLDATKQSSMLDAFAADAAILLSLLLQHGASPADVGHALRRSPNGAPASLIGAVVDELHGMERQQDRSVSC